MAWLSCKPLISPTSEPALMISEPDFPNNCNTNSIDTLTVQPTHCCLSHTKSVGQDSDMPLTITKENEADVNKIPTIPGPAGGGGIIT